jgi:hypothetical protein
VKQTLTLFAGFLGGIVSMRIARTGDGDIKQVIRARSFELVDAAGQAISFWGVDNRDNAVLAFGSRGLAPGGARPRSTPLGLTNPDNQLAALGLRGTDSPLLKMSGADGKTRVRMLLSTDGKPFLLMEDATGPRVSLGIEQSDTPGPGDNDWTLAFYPERARIGMFTEKERGQTYVRGVFLVKRDRVKYP